MTYFGGLQRFSSARSASMPAASIFAQVDRVSRSVRCSSFSSGGFGGLPRGRFCSSMPRTVAPIYEDSNNPCNPDLSDYNKSSSTERTMNKQERDEHVSYCLAAMRDLSPECRFAFLAGLSAARDHLATLSAEYHSRALEGGINSIKRNRNNWKVDAINEGHDGIEEAMTRAAAEYDVGDWSPDAATPIKWQFRFEAEDGVEGRKP